jgi:hypothetical protein
MRRRGRALSGFMSLSPTYKPKTSAVVLLDCAFEPSREEINPRHDLSHDSGPVLATRSPTWSTFRYLGEDFNSIL